LSAQESNYELERTESFDQKLSDYDKLFICYNDALKIVKDELTASTGKQKSSKAETQEENLQLLKTYVSYLKLNKTIDRNLILADSYEQRLPGKDTKETEDAPKKKSKPDDLVRVYETLIQNLTELNELRSDEPEQSKEIAAKILSYKALRCYYMAMTYSFASKWSEALALYHRAAAQMKAAREHLEAVKNASPDAINKLRDLEDKIQGAKAEVHARGFLESVQAKTQTTETKPAVKKEETTSENKETSEAPKASLLTSINEFDFEFAKEKHLVAFPPDFEAVKCKPILFDLALGECTFPSLENRKKAKSSGFWGLFGYKQ